MKPSLRFSFFCEFFVSRSNLFDFQFTVFTFPEETVSSWSDSKPFLSTMPPFASFIKVYVLGNKTRLRNNLIRLSFEVILTESGFTFIELTVPWLHWLRLLACIGSLELYFVYSTDLVHFVFTCPLLVLNWTATSGNIPSDMCAQQTLETAAIRRKKLFNHRLWNMRPVQILIRLRECALRKHAYSNI